MDSPSSAKRYYMTASEAASFSGYTSDYVARLCREGKIPATRTNGSWKISREGFSEALIDIERRKEQRRREISVQRKKTYHRNNTHVIAQRPVTTAARGSIVQYMRTSALVLVVVLLGMNAWFIGNMPPPSVGAPADEGRASDVSFQHALSGLGFLELTAQLGGGLRVALSAIGDLLFPQARFIALHDDSEAYDNDPAVFAEREMRTRSSTHATGAVGMVTIPKTDVVGDKERLIKHVRSSFSDRVIVTPDEEGGMSGVLQPTFRDREGESYFYVMVPVPRRE